jgi:hypothetical protein
VLGNATINKMDAENSKHPEYGYTDEGGKAAAAAAAWRSSDRGVGGGGGGGRRLAEMLTAVQRQAAARSSRAAAPVGRRALMVAKGLSGAAAVDSALSTAVAPYYGAGTSLASPSSALVPSHGRKLSKVCGFDEKDGPKWLQFIRQMLTDTSAQLLQCV